MNQKLTSGNSDESGLEKNNEVDPSNGRVPAETPKHPTARERKFQESVAKINQKFAGLFRRLSK